MLLVVTMPPQVRQVFLSAWNSPSVAWKSKELLWRSVCQPRCLGGDTRGLASLCHGTAFPEQWYWPRWCCHYLDKGGVLSGSCTRYQGEGELRHCHLSCFREGGASGAQGCLCCHGFNKPERVELPLRSLLLIVNAEFLSVLSVGVIIKMLLLWLKALTFRLHG